MSLHANSDYLCIFNAFMLQLCSLPAKPCVVDVLENFLKTFCVNYICEPAGDPLCKERDKVRTEKYALKLPPDIV